MGGSPFGPAGTGKTETVKALAGQLGRLALVFNCDETFDLHAVGRILLGLCQTGAWGCFDEFNRLEERILSAVSQQVLAVQAALRAGAGEVELVGRRLPLRADMAVFITMNPTYAGRSNLPDNLKQLFRGVAMAQPDSELIAEITLYAHGFRGARRLARKAVPLFRLCADQLSPCAHYDFGLRALKSVLVAAGELKRRPTPAAAAAP
jgi:dynein heavy chain 1, cytosolic